MAKAFNGLERIDLFAQEIISQISLGRKESVNEIIKQMENKTVVRYLYNKYKDDWFLSLDDDCPYNVDDWEEKYYLFSYITENDARRKWGIRNEDEGLLLLVSLTFEALREVLHK
ncbi:hypothetical protein [Lachnoclostridium sp. MSJ-17]|uniref:hypothetical protein n=1 Tax=Lachnoclostridium sp. MSJ-17 TaxID=2841516 RepID=UPI001C0FE0F6|nr:hypothetical protein [Lachnoclostridium sp. MSJ-17]MBU5462455.1 hypothetical protein [Lachnoclostridium sp. MSJ-17]